MAMDNRRAQLVRTILNCLGENPPYADNDRGVDLDHRIKIQKLVYLAQELLKRHRMTLHYEDYNWYIRGPYSPALARDCYALDEEGAEAVELLQLRDEAVSALAPLASLKGSRPPELEPHLWLELLASLHYYATRSRCSELDTAQLSAERMHGFQSQKSGFSATSIEFAWRKLREAGLVG